MHNSKPGSYALPSLIALTIAAFLAVGCGSGSSNSSTNSNSQTATGSSFVVGTDAPMASVVSFTTQISISATDANNNTVQLTSGSPTVDFARFNGLQTLIDMNDVNPGAYSNISITLSNGTIGYLDTTQTPPAIQTMTATLPSTPLTFTLTNPMTVAPNGAPVGLHIDFDLRKSIQVDQNGNITGGVNPTFTVKAVNNSDPGAYIDEFDAAVVSTNSGTQSFTIQGPHGRQFTVNVNGQTEWDGGDVFSDLNSNSIVQISGTLDRADATIDADEIAILSDSGFYASGQITYVDPSSTPPTFDLYVRGLLPTTTGLTLGQLATIDLSGSEKYSIYWMHGPLAQFLFNQNGLLAGQHVAVGGPASGASNPNAVSVKRITLRHWGFNGTVVPGSVNTTNGTFQMQVNGFAGLLIPQTVTVYIPDNCTFRDGFSQLTDVSSATNVRVVGLLLKDPLSGNTVLVGHYVDDLD